MPVNWKAASEKASKLDYDPAEAIAMQKLIMKKIQQRLNVISKTFKEHGHLGKGKDKIAKLLKESNFEASKIFKNKNTESKALRRGLAEMLTTNPDFFAKKGLWDVFKQDLSLLEGDKLFSTLKGWDRALSGFDAKIGKVGHHTTLSSLNDALQGTSDAWRTGFNQLAAEEGFRLGTEGISRFAPGVHKAFSTKKGFPNIRMVKGKLAETLAPLMPDTAFTGGRLEIKRGVNPKLDELLDKLKEISTHGSWAGHEQGFKVPKAIDKLSQAEALKIARNTLGAEEAIATHGRKIDKLLDSYLNKSNFNSLDEAVEGLTKKINQPNWQPPNVKDTLIKEVDKSLMGAKQTQSLDVLDRWKAPGTKLLKIAKNPAARRLAALGFVGGGALLSELGVQSRADEVKANPNDPWLKAQLKIDQAGATLDKAALGATAAAPATGGTSLVAAGAAETGSLGLGLLSGGMDLTRHLQKKFGTHNKIKGRSGANRDIRRRATLNIRNSNNMDSMKMNSL